MGFTCSYSEVLSFQDLYWSLYWPARTQSWKFHTACCR